MILVTPSVERGKQYAPPASTAGCRERGSATWPGGWTVCACAPFHVHGAAENLCGIDQVAFDMVVAANKKVVPFRVDYAPMESMCDKTVSGRRVEKDVASSQVCVAHRFNGKEIAVAHERRHAGAACRETDGATLGEKVAGQQTEQW